MTQFNNATESQDDYVIKEASLSSDRGVAFSVDLRKVISDIEIFEHLDKPYLTGQVAFSDNFSVLERIDLQGGELFTLRIQSSQNSNKGPKMFSSGFCFVTHGHSLYQRDNYKI